MGLVLASALAVAGPQLASAKDRGDDRGARDTRQVRVVNQREDRGREVRDRDDYRAPERFREPEVRYTAPVYNTRGYYDASGCWHAYGY